MNRIDRGAFLKVSITLATSGAGLFGCSDGNDPEPGTGGRGGGAGEGATGGGAGQVNATGGSSGASHTHLPLTRPITTMLLNGAPFEFALPNQQGHIHTLSFTQAHLASLREGGTVSITSTIDGGHSHTYDVTCT